jgi:hypothetical protein
VLLSAYGVALLVLLGLAAFLYFGWNWARMLAMLGSTISIVFAFVDYVTGGTDVTLRTTMPTVATDILVVLALSSRSVREYARRPKLRRSRLRAAAAAVES